MIKKILLSLAILFYACAGWAAKASAEQQDIQLGNMAIAADIALGASPKTRSHCTEFPCIGASQSELGLALIAARDTPASAKALAELIRFKLDAGLAEDHACAVIQKRASVGRYLSTIDAKALRSRCIDEYLRVTNAARPTFPEHDANMVCRTVSAIEKARHELLDTARSTTNCP